MAKGSGGRKASGGGSAVSSVVPAAAAGSVGAAEVLAAADSLQGTPGQFGRTKVFLSDVIAKTGVTKDQLLDMHRKGQIRLHRFDLTSAATPEQRTKLASGEVSHNGATFHVLESPKGVKLAFGG